MLQIELFGVLQQAAGGRTLRLEDVPAEIRVAEVLERLAAEQPGLAPHLARVACAQGDSLLRQDQKVDTAHPLVLLPPVSGG